MQMPAVDYPYSYRRQLRKNNETIQLQQLESSPALARDVRRWTEQDPILSRVQYYVHHGWPNKPLIEVLTPYWQRASELSIEEGCVLWGYRVIVPPQGQQRV